MTSTHAVSPTDAWPAAGAPPATGQVMGKEEFLRLLVTQLSNQDPLNPLEGQEFAAQLAQFSSVEQLIHIHELLTSQADLQGLLAQNINNGVAAGLIGRRIEAEGNRLGWSGSGDVPLHFTLEGAASTVTVTIRDEAGQVVRTLQREPLGAGEHEVHWDGTGDGGSPLPEGTYTFEVNAADGNDSPVAVRTWLRGTVERVSFGPEGIRLWIGNIALPMSAVRSVEEGR